MKKTFAVLSAALIGLSGAVAFAQNPAPPKASKADVQKVVASIKGDSAKMTQYCAMLKLEDQMEAMGQSNPNDPKLQALDKQWEGMAAKLGPDFQKITSAQLDQASQDLLSELAKSCK